MDQNDSWESPTKLARIEDALPKQIFLLPIKVRPVFPGIITPLIVPPGRFISSIEETSKGAGFIGLILLKKDDSDEPSETNIYQVGIVARILKKVNLPDGGINILVNTIQRFKIESITQTEPWLIADVSYPEEELGTSKNNIKALMRTLVILTKELSQNNPLFTEDMKLTMLNVNEPGKMSDFVCSILNLEKEDYQSVIEALTLNDRLEKVLLFLKKEIDLVLLQKKIQDQINDKIDNQQRQFFLREQLKAIQQELGLGEEKQEAKYDKLLDRLKAIPVSSEVLKEVEREVEKIKNTDPMSSDYNVIRNYLDLIEALPWEAPKPKEINLLHAKKILNRDHYKLEDVKERILEYLAVRKLNPKSRGSILCLVGPPGVGKTSIAKSVAEALGKKYYRFSVGGMRDEAEIKGHRRTYIGAMPGKLINALKITKERDPVILLDEIDKMSQGFQGDPQAALLEVLDPEQNASFRDHYLDLPFDLSDVFFLATANTYEPIPRVLLDRMEVIQLSGYIAEEKVQIFEKYLWKKTFEKNGLNPNQFSMKKETILHLINSYSRESGLRGLEKQFDKLVRKIALKQVLKEKYAKEIKEKDILELLGAPIFTDDRMVTPKVPGTALGLAWTSAGGSTLLIEAVFVTGKGGILLTGQMGKMMEESANIALSFIKNYLADDKIFENKSIHLHVPDGATPKDGPSAGITMATALLSLARGQVVRPGFGMTGELTLTGEVLPIGGLREKIVAAKRVGVKQIIYPKDNEKAFLEIPDYVKKGVKFFPVSHFSEVAALVLPKEKKGKGKKR
ncbi:endopeptidase La [Leptospira ryugenii]|uniref:Lon protease n=1 Tax=Leptospira ryugenii TaxID=1917863 RepID=A0A2P2DZS9_9LEPT|nr:endopeptidase La [Leptospira ryugenii]GBF50138.1 endopeptidase La [Leptospira ryugenii]